MDLVSIGDLAAIFGRNKSAINYYYNVGLISPMGTAGKTAVFDKKETIAAIKKIEALKDKGKSIAEIREIFKV